MTMDLQDAIAQAADAAAQLGTVTTTARRRVVELEMELEDARRVLGRYRARDVDRELLGLDGRTGAKDVNAEVGR